MAFKFNPITGSLDKTVSGVENPNDSVTLKHSGTTVLKTLSDGVNIPLKSLQGITSSRLIGNTNCIHQIEGTGGATGLSITRNSSTTTHSPKLIFGKSGGSATNSDVAVAANHVLGEIRFSGADGSDLTNYAASIVALVDDAVSTNVVPGRLEFRTTAGSDADTPAMTIDKNGKCGIGIDPTQKLTVQGTILKTRTDSGVGLIYLQNDGSENGNIIINQKDGVTRVKLNSEGDSYFNGGNVGIAKTNPQAKLDVNGSAIFRSTLAFFDDTLAADSSSGTENRIKIGNNGDLQLFHDGRTGKNNSVLRSLSGDLQINSGNSAGNVQINLNENVAGETKELSAEFIKNGGVKLYHNGLGPKLETDSTGARVSGALGINESAPSVTLDITGEGGGNGEIHVKRISGAECQVQAQAAVAVFGSTSNHKLQLKSNSTTALTIDTNQRIGIGETDPDALLHVNSGAVNTCATFESTDAGVVINLKDNSARSSIEQNGTDLKIIADTGAEDDNSTIKLQVDASTKMTIDASGNIGAPSGSNIHNASDSRLKTNVVDIDKGLSAIKSLRPVSFNWIDGFCEAETNTLYGFIAQEVQSVDNNLIQDFSQEITVDGTKIENVLRVNEKFIIPMLVKAVQELSVKVEALEAA